MIPSLRRYQIQLDNIPAKYVTFPLIAITAFWLVAAAAQKPLFAILLYTLTLAFLLIPFFLSTSFFNKRKPEVLYLPVATTPPLKLLPANRKVNR
jgi:predicted neutral ceramidase superfamily lipid hydrolase